MYIKIVDKDINKATEALNNVGIIITDVFDNIYEKMCEENIRYYISDLISDEGGFLRNKEYEEFILNAEGDVIEDIIRKSTDMMYDNEYLSEVIGECTTDAIEGGLRELFVEVGNDD